MIRFIYIFQIIVAGGYWDGRLVMHSVDTDTIMEIYSDHVDTITSIAADNKENFLITGEILLIKSN